METMEAWKAWARPAASGQSELETYLRLQGDACPEKIRQAKRLWNEFERRQGAIMMPARIAATLAPSSRHRRSDADGRAPTGSGSAMDGRAIQSRSPGRSSTCSRDSVGSTRRSFRTLRPSRAIGLFLQAAAERSEIGGTVDSPSAREAVRGSLYATNRTRGSS
jgi:hypothetical protein